MLSSKEATRARRKPWRGRFVALDMNDRKVEAVLAEHHGRGTRILKLAALDIEEGIDRKDGGALGRWLGVELAARKMKGGAVVMSVPRSRASLIPLRLPDAQSANELAGMVQYQMLREIPFKAEDAVIDFIPGSHYRVSDSAGEGEGGVEVLAGAIHREQVQFYSEMAEGMGMKLLRLGLRPYADVRCMRELMHVGAEEHVGMVHVTAQETEIGVMAGGGLEFSRSAQIRIFSEGDTEQGVAGGVDMAAMDRAAAERVVAEVRRTLQVYEGFGAGTTVDRVVVAGDCGIEGRVAGMLDSVTGMRGEIVDPTRQMKMDTDGWTAGSCVTAIGLAMADRDDGEQEFDFLSPRKPQVRKSAVKRFGPAVAIAAAVLVLGVTMLLVFQFRAKKNMVADMRTRNTTLTADNKAMTVLEKEVKEYQKWEDGSEAWLDHWAYLSSLFPSAEDAYIQGLKTSKEGISFSMRARSTQVIATLGEKIQAAGYDYRPERMEAVDDALGYRFSMSMRVTPTDAVKVDVSKLQAVPRPSDDDSLNQSARQIRGRRR